MEIVTLAWVYEVLTCTHISTRRSDGRFIDIDVGVEYGRRIQSENPAITKDFDNFTPSKKLSFDLIDLIEDILVF